MTNKTHWTERSTEDFLYSIASDFIEQIRTKMGGMKAVQLSKRSGVSKGRISQIFKDPSNVSLDTMIKLARGLGLKLAVAAYEDIDDPKNERGPVNSEIFTVLWTRAGRPFDMWDIKALPTAVSTGERYHYTPKAYWILGQPIYSASIKPMFEPETGQLRTTGQSVFQFELQPEMGVS